MKNRKENNNINKNRTEHLVSWWNKFKAVNTSLEEKEENNLDAFREEVYRKLENVQVIFDQKFKLTEEKTSQL